VTDPFKILAETELDNDPGHPVVAPIPEIVPWWMPDPGAVNDVNPICGCHISARCDGCRVCKTCDGCYCFED
jgi:hypothetical protein